MAYGTVNADLMTTSDGVSSSGLYGFKNRIINGAMVIDQRNAGASISVGSSAVYPVDRFQARIAQGSGHTGQQVSTAPTGFNNSLKITIGTGASPTAGQNTFINQQIEGFNFADLGWGTASAKTITVSFWVYSSLTGTFAFSMANNGLDRSYVATYSIPTANTWTYISLTIAGDTSGTWIGATNGIGSYNFFDLGSGSNKNTTAGTWQAGWYTNTSSTVNVAGTSGATFYITGVQLEKGSTATSFDYRPYGTELQLCQRYYWQSTSKANGTQFWEFSGAVTDGTTARINFYLPTAMRAQPSIAINPAYNTGSSWQINVTGITNYALTQAPTILGNDGAASGGGNMIAIAFKSSGMSSAHYGLGAIPYATTGTATNNFQFSAEL